MRVALLLLLAFGFCGGSEAAKILSVFCFGFKSHLLSALPIIESLAEKGHEVTLVTPFENLQLTTNIHQIYVEEWAELFKEEDKRDYFAMQKQNSFSQIMLMFLEATQLFRKAYTALMTHPEIQQIIEDQKIDLMLIDAFVTIPLPLADVLGVPVVGHYSNAGTLAIFNKLGISPEYASVPAGLIDFDDPMSFFQRMANMFSATTMMTIIELVFTSSLEQAHKENYPNSRSVSDMAKDLAIALVNSHPTTAWQRPLPPNVIPIGSVHTRPAKSLEEGFKTFADSSSNGFIVFSLGSMVPISSMPANLQNIFFSVFAKLPQNIICKWETDELPSNLPKNVMTTKWLPQQDLLGHPNARLIILHGGLLGINEAIYNSIPVLGLPFGNDQRTNVVKAQKEGYLIKLDWDSITEDILYETIQKLINEPSYKENASRVSRLVRDELVPGVELSVYWIEHVLRHKGAKHLQLASRNLPFYQNYLLDIWLFLFIVVIFVLVITYGLIRLLLRSCFNKSYSNLGAKVKEQ